MRYLTILIASALCLALPACVHTSPTIVATKTVTSANLIYTRASRAGAVLVAQGQMTRAQYQALDNAAFDVLLKVRAGKATLDQLLAATSALSGDPA